MCPAVGGESGHLSEAPRVRSTTGTRSARRTHRAYSGVHTAACSPAAGVINDQGGVAGGGGSVRQINWTAAEAAAGWQAGSGLSGVTSSAACQRVSAATAARPTAPRTTADACDGRLAEHDGRVVAATERIARGEDSARRG